MIDCRFIPIQKWSKKPTPSYSRRDRFSAPWSKTLDLLERELVKLRAKEIVIEAFFHPSDIRNDGWPRSNARASQPGVILRFTTKKGIMEFACDRFADWQQNLRAIALGLEKLRMIDEYGIIEVEEQQYTGWLKLPAASATDEAQQLALILCKYAATDETKAKTVVVDQKMFESVWREAVRRTHPDQNPERSGADFNNVIQARDRLKQLKGWQ
jgi:hypothetical protein